HLKPHRPSIPSKRPVSSTKLSSVIMENAVCCQPPAGEHELLSPRQKPIHVVGGDGVCLCRFYSSRDPCGTRHYRHTVDFNVGVLRPSMVTVFWFLYHED